jgi:hypothetical protein
VSAVSRKLPGARSKRVTEAEASMLSIRRTEELRDAQKFKYPNMVSMLAIAGINLVFLNHSDGTFAA